MTASEIAADGTALLHTLTAPGRGLGQVAERRRVALALAVATLASLLTAAVVVPRVDFDAAAAARIDRPQPAQGGGSQEELTPYQREEAIATARKLGQISAWAGAALAPSALAFGAAVFLLLGFRVAGTSPGFRPTLAVAAHGMLPVWLGGLFAIPAAVAHAPVPTGDLATLLPSSLAALAPRGAPPPLVAALSGLDLFSLWAVALVAAGMARAAGCSRRRALVVTAVLFVSYVALLKVVPSALAAGGPGPR